MGPKSKSISFLEEQLGAANYTFTEADPMYFEAINAHTKAIVPTYQITRKDRPDELVASYQPSRDQVVVDDDHTRDLPALQRVFAEYDRRFRTGSTQKRPTTVATFEFLMAASVARNPPVTDFEQDRPM